MAFCGYASLPLRFLTIDRSASPSSVIVRWIASSTACCSAVTLRLTPAPSPHGISATGSSTGCAGCAGIAGCATGDGITGIVGMKGAGRGDVCTGCAGSAGCAGMAGCTGW